MVDAASEAQLRDQAVLEATPDALYAAFRLGGVGQDEPDVQLLQGPTELGGVAPASQLLGKALGLFGRALEDAMPVTV